MNLSLSAVSPEPNNRFMVWGRCRSGMVGGATSRELAVRSSQRPTRSGEDAEAGI
jgi:hypothetical protein